MKAIQALIALSIGAASCGKTSFSSNPTTSKNSPVDEEMKKDENAKNEFLDTDKVFTAKELPGIFIMGITPMLRPHVYNYIDGLTFKAGGYKDGNYLEETIILNHSDEHGNTDLGGARALALKSCGAYSFMKAFVAYRDMDLEENWTHRQTLKEFGFKCHNLETGEITEVDYNLELPVGVRSGCKEDELIKSISYQDLSDTPTNNQTDAWYSAEITCAKIKE